ncbi:hypothetical protein L195_g034810 [Trifolium pratense]|uniref:Uncharacterized protein n=1 Tax=Trifolium pratense TaxID=57577 RepID=A0A2K3LK12_TRIPR|nr:hypothetical protein L195_g034810 [Trifolium pratense]
MTFVREAGSENFEAGCEEITIDGKIALDLKQHNPYSIRGLKME